MNPFQPQFVRMKFPEGSANQISISGFNLTAEKDGCVELPKHLQKDAESHGLVKVEDKAK